MNPISKEVESSAPNSPTVEAGDGLTKELTPGVWYYRGWTISPDDFGGGWTATNANYDVSWEGEEDGFVDNGEKVTGDSLSACCDEIDAWIDEAEEAEHAEEAANHDSALRQEDSSHG